MVFAPVLFLREREIQSVDPREGSKRQERAREERLRRGGCGKKEVAGDETIEARRMEGEEREGRAARKRRSASRKKGRCFRNRRSAPGERSREEPSISSYSVAPGAMVDPPMAVAMVRLTGLN